MTNEKASIAQSETLAVCVQGSLALVLLILALLATLHLLGLAIGFTARFGNLCATGAAFALTRFARPSHFCLALRLPSSHASLT